MFYLRTISGDKNNVQKNQTIGDSYELILRFESSDDFRFAFNNFFDKDHVADLDPESDYDTVNVYGFLSTGESRIPLYKDRKYYVMTEGGSTFANITY